MWPNTQIAKHIGEQIATRGDDRLGLGYGQLDQKFHKPWVTTGTFPYDAPDQLEDDQAFDEESQEAVISKIPHFQRTDSLAFKKANRLYYAGASTKLRACFERPDEVLEEIIGVSRGTIPIPGLYGKGPGGPAVGGFSSGKANDQRPFRRTGTKRGWASAPPQSVAAAEDEYEEDRDPEEFYSLLELADIQRPSLGECFLIMAYT